LSIDSIDGKGQARHIFNKGTAENYTSENPLLAATIPTKIGFAGPNNGPGLYLDGSLNTLYFVMDVISPTGGTIRNSSTITITNIPMKKWFHLAFRLENKVMDVYINGTIVQRETFDYIPKQNYDNVNIGNNGGFAGSISNLRYYSKALSAFEINKIVRSGPNTSASKLSNKPGSSYDYLGASWFQSKWFS
jgi:hypothetical protein